ncbi:hypothetical protein CGCSCA5_v013820 [Colletotrichum siamense]|nr:hypothetical protein CGCSCA5_v013820 [Colletotrichum siamense]KAF4880018.1 hypothetical protein CGCSCA1_v001398 [Colletotrichum siamense]KAI8186619.1 hypothetical protein K4K51_010295 [Colletotrichum sp. SAR 10_75]KAI8219251.1 hypothetical protein K4K53_008407 [Colletotrichum sp. SAR 10_77]
MVLHRQQAQFDRARWRMALLLPFWILQMMVLLAVIGLFSWRLSDTLRNWDSQVEDKGMFPTVEVVWESVNIGFSLICLFSTIYEVSKLAAETLTPWTMIFTHVLKFVCSMATLALDIVVFTQRKDSHYSVVGLGLDCFLILLISVPGIYAIQTYRRLAKYDDYHYPVNHKPYGFNDLEQNTTYNSRLSIGGLSLGDRSLRRISTSSAKSGTSSPHGSIPQPQPEPKPLQRTPSQYNNERDTQFDRYMVERAMNTEFGWASSPPADNPLARSDSFIGSGSVANTKVVTRESMGRAPSWGSSHVLVAVPEMDEDDAPGRGDRQALLGHRRNDSGDSVGPSSPPYQAYQPPSSRVQVPIIEVEESDITAGTVEFERKRKRSQ